MKSAMKHQFSEVPRAEITRSQFNRSHGYKTTLDSSWLIPIYCDEALPGDTFNLNMTAFARMATPIKPIMDNVYMDTFFFAVPNRLLWANWEKFMGAQDNPSDSTDFFTPYVHILPGEATEQSIYDYMGIPIHATGRITPCSLHMRAYNLIWNEWFRDENLQNSIYTGFDQESDLVTDFTLKKRGKRHDYFTSCLPWPQKGDPVTVPTLGTAPVVATTDPLTVASTSGGTGFPIQTDNAGFVKQPSILSANQLYGGDPTGYEVDLTQATAIQIADLRIAFQFQKMLERDARGGTRYTEVIKAHFGVTSPDARLQRPEFLGGGSTRVTIKPVEQNVPEIVADGTPQGNLAAYGTAHLYNHGFTKSFTEHCVIIGLVNVRADLSYQQGLNRMWLRSDRYDYYFPAFQSIGEQIVWNVELFATSTDGLPGRPVSQGGAGGLSFGVQEYPTTQDVVLGGFGYQERWAEYRYKPSSITGKFRSTSAEPLDIWHLAQEFATEPDLNSAFIEDNPPIARVIAIQDEPQFLFDSYFDLKCARPMPLYSVPGNIDRF